MTQIKLTNYKRNQELTAKQEDFILEEGMERIRKERRDIKRFLKKRWGKQ